MPFTNQLVGVLVSDSSQFGNIRRLDKPPPFLEKKM